MNKDLKFYPYYHIYHNSHRHYNYDVNFKELAGIWIAFNLTWLILFIIIFIKYKLNKNYNESFWNYSDLFNFISIIMIISWCFFGIIFIGFCIGHILFN